MPLTSSSSSVIAIAPSIVSFERHAPLLKGMHHPDIFPERHDVDGSVRVTAMGQAISDRDATAATLVTLPNVYFIAF